MAAWQGLLKKTNVYRWGEEHEKALVKVKEIITNPTGSVLKHFDLKFPIRTLTDTSRTSLGFCLVQMEPKSETPNLVTVRSGFLSPAEKNYASVELE